MNNGKIYTGRYGTVDKNGKITYKVKIKNNNKKTYKIIDMIDEAPIRTEFEINNANCIIPFKLY